jgi:hypothetical protein
LRSAVVAEPRVGVRSLPKLDKRFVEYLLEFSGRIIEVLQRAAFQRLADKS